MTQYKDWIENKWRIEMSSSSLKMFLHFLIDSKCHLLLRIVNANLQLIDNNAQKECNQLNDLGFGDLKERRFTKIKNDSYSESNNVVEFYLFLIKLINKPSKKYLNKKKTKGTKKNWDSTVSGNGSKSIHIDKNSLRDCIQRVSLYKIENFILLMSFFKYNILINKF